MKQLTLFFKLAKYFKRKYYKGGLIRWMISSDKQGAVVYCVGCGNIANGVLHITKFGLEFNLPFCKSHISKILNEDQPDNDGFVLPSVIDIHDANLVTLRLK